MKEKFLDPPNGDLRNPATRPNQIDQTITDGITGAEVDFLPLRREVIDKISV